MLRRIYRCEPLNEVVNHKDILPLIGWNREGKIDLSSLFKNKKNLFFLTENGFISITNVSTTIYEIHCGFTKQAKKNEKWDGVREVINHTFELTPCINLIAPIASANLPARIMARKMGFEFVGKDLTFYDNFLDQLNYLNYGLNHQDWRGLYK